MSEKSEGDQGGRPNHRKYTPKEKRQVTGPTAPPTNTDQLWLTDPGTPGLHEGPREELLLAELRRCLLAVRRASRAVDDDGRAERLGRRSDGDRGDHRPLQPSPAAFVAVVLAAGGLLSRRSDDAPGRVPARRDRRLQEARELRKQENLKLRQRLIPWRQEELRYSKRPVVSL